MQASRWLAAAFTAAAAVVVLAWLTGSVLNVPSGRQAVVWQFGRARVQAPGILLAWPWPCTQVAVLPGPDEVETLPVDGGNDGGVRLTGDGNAIRLGGTVRWRVADAKAYAVARDEIAAALASVFAGAAVAVAASHRLEDFASGNLGDEVAAGMNQRLQALASSAWPVESAPQAANGPALGVEVVGVVVTATLPSGDHGLLDPVRRAVQRANEAVAAAGAAAGRLQAQAVRVRDSMLIAAHASAEERVAAARIATATISALEGGDRQARAGLLDRLYRDRIGGILARAGAVETVDAKAVSHLVLPR